MLWTRIFQEGSQHLVPSILERILVTAPLQPPHVIPTLNETVFVMMLRYKLFCGFQSRIPELKSLPQHSESENLEFAPSGKI